MVKLTVGEKAKPAQVIVQSDHDLFMADLEPIITYHAAESWVKLIAFVDQLPRLGRVLRRLDTAAERTPEWWQARRTIEPELMDIYWHWVAISSHERRADKYWRMMPPDHDERIRAAEAWRIPAETPTLIGQTFVDAMTDDAFDHYPIVESLLHMGSSDTGTKRTTLERILDAEAHRDREDSPRLPAHSLALARRRLLEGGQRSRGDGTQAESAEQATIRQLMNDAMKESR